MFHSAELLIIIFFLYLAFLRPPYCGVITMLLWSTHRNATCNNNLVITCFQFYYQYTTLGSNLILVTAQPMDDVIPNHINISSLLHLFFYALFAL